VPQTRPALRLPPGRLPIVPLPPSTLPLITGDLPATFRIVSAPLAVVVACATLLAGRSAMGATTSDDICLPGGPACEAPAATDEFAEYATPAEVNCPSVDLRADRADTTHTFDVRGVSWDCSPPTLVFHYRMSRLPESERSSGALRPQRGHRNTRPIASCTGLPPERGIPLSASTTQPIAMYAGFALIPPPERLAVFESIVLGPTRVLEPLDRPPRA